MSSSPNEPRLVMPGPPARVGGPVLRAQDPGATLQRLVPYLTTSRAMAAGVTVCVLASTLAGIVAPWLLGRAIDRGVLRHDEGELGRMALAMLGAYAVSNLAQVLAGLATARLAQEGLRRLREALFARLDVLPMAWFDGAPAGDVMSRLTSDVDTIQQAAAQAATALVASALTMLGTLVAMFALDARLAVVSLAVVPVMLWFTRFVARYTRKGFQAVQRALGGLNAAMEESLAGHRVVRAFQRDGAALAAFRAKNDEAAREGVAANSYALLLMPLTAVLGNVFVIALAGLGGWLALRGAATVGLVATFLHYGQGFVQPLRNVSTLYNTLQSALAGAERVFEVLDAPAEPDGGTSPLPSPLRGHVRFEDVAFSYRAGSPVLHGVSLDAPPGAVVALVGPTGAGKTTVLNLLTRFYELDAGRITLDGVDLRTLRKDDLRRCLAVVPQETFLFAATVRENLRYGRADATDAEVEAAAVMAEADGFIRQLAQGYDTVLAARGANLSQGQRQLLAIARALVANPTILVLDEATSSVDTRTEARIQRAMRRAMHGRTSFVVAHRLTTIRDADEVLVIEGGTVVERGTHDALVARGGRYARMVAVQYQGAST